MEARRTDLLPIDLGPLGHPDASQAGPGMLDDLSFPPHFLLNPLLPLAGIGHIEPHFFHTGKDTLDWLQPELDALPIWNTGDVDDDFEHQTHGVNQDVSLPA